MEDRASDKGEALSAAQFAVLGSQVESTLVEHLGAPEARPANDLVRVRWQDFRSVRASWDGGQIECELPLNGRHQLWNLQLALALAHGAVEMGWLDNLEPAAVVDAMRRVRWPGRLSHHQVMGRRVLVDCAHNEEGAHALAGHLAEEPVLYHLLFSCLDDKPVEAMARALWPHVGNVAVCGLEDTRAMAMERLREAFPQAVCAPSVQEALRQLPSPIVAAGSVRLVGELLTLGGQEGEA